MNDELECGICHAKVPPAEAIPKEWVAAIKTDLERDSLQFRFLLCPACLPVVETFIETQGRQ